MADYSEMTQTEFDAILHRIVAGMTTAQILAYGDVYSILVEELNNDVLSEWEEENPDKAFPS